MTISIFGACILLFSLIISTRAFCAIIRQDASSRKISRRMSKWLAVILPVLAILAVVMLRYSAIAAWSKSILPARLIALMRKGVEVVFGTRSFSLMIQSVLVASSLPVLLLSIYSVTTDLVPIEVAPTETEVTVAERSLYRAPELGETKTFLTLLQIRI